MAFAATYDASNGLSTGETAIAAHIVQNFTDIETELNAFPTDGVLADGAVSTAAKLASNVVTSAKIKALNVTTAKLAADCVDATKLADDAVVDANIDTSGSFSIFGAWTTTDSLDADLAKDPDDDSIVYKALTDMQVSAAMTGVTSPTIYGFTDSTSPPTTLAQTASFYFGPTTGYVAICFPVKKGEYWKVRGTGTVTIRFLPVGTGTCALQ